MGSILKFKLLTFLLQLGFTHLRKVRILRHFIPFVSEINVTKQFFFEVDVHESTLDTNIR